MVFNKRRASDEPERESFEPANHQLVDAETGLPNYRQLTDILKREIARSRRYGDRSAVVVFDVRVVGFKPSASRSSPVSPARFVSEVLATTARDADVVARLDLTHWVALLTESDYEGAQKFADRARTALASSPFMRNDDQSGIYVRAWAGCACWDPAHTDPAAFVRAAVDDMESGRAEYEAERSWFAGRAAG